MNVELVKTERLSARQKVEFTVNGAMVLDVREHAPLSGILDLNGLPWYIIRNIYK